ANTDLAMLKKNLTDIEQILNRIAKKSKDLKFPTSAGDKGRAGGKGRGGGGGRGGTKNGTGPSAVGGADVPDTGETNYDASSMRYNYIDPARPFSSAIINKFPRASVAVGVGSAVVGAGYQMLPGVEDSVARQQAIYQATLGYGFGTNMGSFMRMRSNINSAFGNTMTSPISGAATSAVLRDAGITVANSQGMLTSTAARMMQGAGAFSMLNGASNEQNATAMANVGTNFTMGNRLLMLGIRTLDKNGNPRNISDIANQLARRSFGRQGGKFNQRDLDRGLRGYLGGALAQYIPDADTRELAIQSLRVQAQAGGKNVPMTDASLRKIGIYNSLTNPMASLAQKTSAEARQSSMDQGALQGFDAANRNAARALDAVTDNLGGFGSALMRVKAYMETFMNSKPGGAAGSLLSTAGTVLGLRALGMGGGRGGAGGGAGGGLLTR
ncbi:MAG: hypothetical protein EBY32_19510, partial [Proteobacteria bacterium]|nr:hypothetical protein [Pseudomonadota bacterium]